MKKNLIAFFLASTLTLSLAGCSGNDANANANANDPAKGNTDSHTNTTQEEPTPPTPEERIAAASLKSNQATSVKALTTMKMKDTAGEMDMDMTMDISYLSNPIKFKADMNISLGAMGAMDLVMYGAAEGDAYTTYTQMEDQWMAQQISSSEAAQYNTLSDLNLYLSNCFEMKADGTEDLSAGTADKYTGVIKGEAIKDVLESSGITDSMDTTLSGEDTEQLEKLFDDVEDMPISIWIDQETDYPVKLTFDMTAAINSIMDAAIEAAEEENNEPVDKSQVPQFETAQLEMVCSDFNNVSDFEIPAEALAVPVEEA